MLRSRPDQRGEANLDEAAALTGGKLYRAPLPSFHGQVVNAFTQAFNDFRQSYVIRFTPKDVPREGWHDLLVEVPTASRRYVIRARKGYFGASADLLGHAAGNGGHGQGEPTVATGPLLLRVSDTTSPAATRGALQRVIRRHFE
jgi:hypothetical protein